MKNNKGFTVFELLVGFVFLIIIGYFLLTTMFSIRDKQQLNVIKSKLVDFKTTLTNDLEMDLIKFKFISKSSCGTNCIDITFSNSLVKRLQLDINNNRIIYGDTTYDLVQDSYFVPPFAFETQVINDTVTGRKNSVFKINIPIEHTDVKGSYGIYIVQPYDANTTITPINITMKGDSVVNVSIGTTYTDAGATAYSPNDGDITSSVVTNNDVDTSTIGTYSVTYEVEDSYGYTAMVERIVNVVAPPASFAYSGTIDTHSILYTGTYRITAIGAQGGGGNGGKGAKMIGEFNLTNGTVLKIVVGQQGGTYGTGYPWAGGGGGGTYVVKVDNNSSYAMTDGTKVTPLIIAGGGGGAFLSNPSVCDASTGLDGKNGAGYNSYAPGTGGNSATTGSYGYGGGGFLVDTNSTYLGRSFLSGSIGGSYTTTGGFGGGGGARGYDSYNATTDVDTYYGGAGGGGGYSGGGGGYGRCADCLPDNGYGGGGGSYNVGTNQSNTTGIGTGNGSVKIEMVSGS